MNISDVSPYQVITDHSLTIKYHVNFHLINNDKMHTYTKNVFTVSIIFNSPNRLPEQLAACQTENSDSAATITTNKMAANKTSILSKSTGMGGIY